jgi:Flp pilus assembly protein TadD
MLSWFALLKNGVIVYGLSRPPRPYGRSLTTLSVVAGRGHVKGDQDKAIADYNEAIRLKPENARAYFNRGIAYQAKGDLDKAEQDFAKAKALGYVPKRTANQGLSL